MRLKLLSWNVAGRTRMMREQARALARREPDIVALQEVRPSTLPRWSRALAEIGLDHVLDSAAFSNGRRIFNLTASRWELTELPAVGAPQPERVLSAVGESPAGQIEIHNAHVPPAGDALKAETSEALYTALATPCNRHRVLCGDLNSERSVPAELADWDLRDVFQALNGHGRREASWGLRTRARRNFTYRIDHILASAELNPIRCDYMHGWREIELSDHSAMEAVFEPAGA